MERVEGGGAEGDLLLTRKQSKLKKMFAWFQCNIL